MDNCFQCSFDELGYTEFIKPGASMESRCFRTGQKNIVLTNALLEHMGVNVDKDIQLPT